MKTSKDYNADKVERVTKTLSILTHPERFMIIELLNENEPMSVGQMAEKLKRSQSETSCQFSLMYDYYLLKKHWAGKKIIYSPNRELLDYIADFTSRLSN